MRGSPKRQAKALVAQLKRYGQSKHAAKAEARRTIKPGTKFTHSLGIHSHGTARSYESVYARFLGYVREAHNIRNASHVTSEHAREWLELNLNRKLTYGSFQVLCSALEKIPSALGIIGVEQDPESWSKAIQMCRQEGKKTLSNEKKSRAYKYPFRIVEQLKGNHHIASAIQLKAGLRISELAELKIGRNMVKPNMLRLTNTKGGLVREVQVPPNLYQKLMKAVDDHGVFKIDRQEYAADLKKAALKIEGQFHGSHGLRWCYIRNEMFRLEMEGLSFDESLLRVSHACGHRRKEISQYYLR